MFFMHNRPMHPVSHAVEIPLNQLERILLAHTREDFEGSVDIEVSVSREAVRLIDMSAETHEFQQVRGCISPGFSEIGQPRAPKPQIDREAIVRHMVAENAGKLRLVSTVRKIVAHFTRGELKKLEWVLPA
jgi:hypothetical protein